MKTLYLECAMGAAGNMLMAALLELLPEQDAFLARVNALGIPHVHVFREKSCKCGIQGTSIHVHIDGKEETAHHEHHADHHSHEHRSLGDTRAIISGLAVSDRVKKDAAAVYTLIAEAESHVHGQRVTEIHFHEVGALDAVIDIVSVCMLMEQLAPDIVLASAVHLGSGHVQCAHGLLPVPAPATAYLLRGIPSCAGNIQAELCTPTGAALLSYFVHDFGPQPLMSVQAIGYGMGTKDFPQANCVRAFWGEQPDSTFAQDTVTEIVCNLDDMTGEALGFAQEILFANGALDVWSTPIQMKKGRPGYMLSCLCCPADAEKMASLILRQTTTLGVRMRDWERRCLERCEQTAATPWGAVRIKTGSAPGITRTKAAYEDLARIAREHDLTLDMVRDAIRAAQDGSIR